MVTASLMGGCDGAFLHDVRTIDSPNPSFESQIEIGVVTSNIGVVETAGRAPGGAGEARLTWSSGASGGVAQTVVVNGAEPSVPSRVLYAREAEANECQLNVPELVSAATLACPVPAEDPELFCVPVSLEIPTTRVTGGRACSFAELAISSRAGARALGLSVNTSGCANGQLRLGIFDSVEGHLILRGPAVRSNVYLGVDPSPDGRCTGSDLATSVCPADGASAIALSLDAQAPSCGTACDAVATGVAVWLSRSSACPGSDRADVRFLGVFMEEGPSGGRDIGWATGANDGAPRTLGRTRGVRPPAVARGVGDGFVIGFVDETNHIVFRLARAPEAPPSVSLGTTGPDLAVPRPTLPFELTEVSGSIPSATGMPIDGLRVARGAIREEGLDVGLIWREGTEDSATVLFSVARFGTGALIEFSEPQTVEASIQSPVWPDITYLPDGMARLGTVVAGETVRASIDGGWVLIFGDRRQLRVRRVLEADGRLTDEAPLGANDGINTFSVRFPFIYPSGREDVAAARFAYFDVGRAAQILYGGEVRFSPLHK